MHDEVLRAIFDMTRLPPDHPFHLNESLAHRAANVLSAIVNTTAIPAPKIINEHGEALTFTWKLDAVKRYLSVDDEIVELRDSSLSGPEEWEIELGDKEELDIREIIDIWGQKLKNSSTENTTGT